MPMRSSSLANNPLAITREMDGRYDVVLQVRDNLDLIEQVAGIDFAAILAELESAQDFTGITVVQGETVAWDAVNKILTVPKGDKGDKGDTGSTGLTGPQGIKGDTGLKGDTGSQGPKGFDGEDGAQGPKGDTGDDLTITQITYNGNGTFNWLFSDGTTYVTPDLRGPAGATGSQGVKGDTGTGVHHLKGTSTTQLEGDFGVAGETDTYTFYADAGETIPLGWFIVTNGVSTAGDMQKSVYDTNNSGVVDNAEKVNGLTVQTAVPIGAVFTDTVYTHPTTDGSLHVPATSTTNNGKVLMAGATAGSISWQTIPSGVTNHTLLTNIGTNTHAQIDTAMTRLANTSGTNTGDQTITLTGDITGTGTGSFATALSNTGVSAGTFTKLTTDVKGRITAASNITASDVPNLDTSKITTGILSVSRGGTGVSTISGLVKGNGTGAMTAAVAGTDYVLPNGNITGNAATATKLATVRTINGSGFDGASDITLQNNIVSYNGTAEMYIPMVFANSAGIKNIYQDFNGLLKYDFNTTTFYSPNFNGNLNGNSSTATKLATSVTIAGATFDGSTNINISFSNLTDKPTTLAGYSITDAYTKTEADTSLASKQATLVSGTSIKTVNGTSILGSGDIVTTDSTKMPLSGGTFTGAVAGTTFAGDLIGKLATPRTINGVSFDGSADINIENRKGVNIASATTTTIGTAGLGNYIHITGTTTITSLGTAANAGLKRTLIFDGALTITNGANLICVGGANIVTVANTIVSVIAETTTQWRVEYVIHPSVSFAELGYLDGVTSAIQTQINSKFTTASATESSQGLVELATTAEAQAGISDTTAITPLKLRNAFNASGTAPVYASRAWVNFNGTGTVAIRASGNVSSITDNGVGDYTVNFTTAMPDANYSMGGGTQAVISGGSAELISFKDGVAPLAGSARIITHRTGVGNVDTTYATVTFFR